MEAPTLGPPQFASKTSHPVSDDVRIPERIEIGAKPRLQFQVAGARAKLFFDQKKTVLPSSASGWWRSVLATTGQPERFA